jgi:hypothetical protein
MVGDSASDHGLTRITREQLDRLVEVERANGAAVYTLTTGEGADKAALFNAVRAALPLDPPLGTFRDVWDALSDSIFGGLALVDASRVVVAWPDAEEMRRTHPTDARDAEQILNFVAEMAAQPRFTANNPKAFRVYLT